MLAATRSSLRWAASRGHVRCLQTEAVIGSREVIERKRIEYEAKYRPLLEKAAKAKGIELEELKQQALLKRAATARLALPPKSVDPTKLQQVQAGSIQKEAVSSSAVKPLSSILDIAKLLSRTPPVSAKEITALWAGYHTSSSSKSRLGAVVPLNVYRKMQALSKLYPEFVLPLPRESSDGVKGAEMIFLQWGALPSGTSSTLPTSVLFTSLAAYKTHGTFAQPALCVTHYTDLADSHGIVLLRGEITASESSGQALMSPTDAQLLLLRLQQYYAADEGTEQRDLVESFHGKGSREFDVDKLAATAWSLT